MPVSRRHEPLVSALQPGSSGSRVSGCANSAGALGRRAQCAHIILANALTLPVCAQLSVPSLDEGPLLADKAPAAAAGTAIAEGDEGDAVVGADAVSGSGAKQSLPEQKAEGCGGQPSQPLAPATVGGLADSQATKQQSENPTSGAESLPSVKVPPPHPTGPAAATGAPWPDCPTSRGRNVPEAGSPTSTVQGASMTAAVSSALQSPSSAAALVDPPQARGTASARAVADASATPTQRTPERRSAMDRARPLLADAVAGRGGDTPGRSAAAAAAAAFAVAAASRSEGSTPPARGFREQAIQARAPPELAGARAGGGTISPPTSAPPGRCSSAPDQAIVAVAATEKPTRREEGLHISVSPLDSPPTPVNSARLWLEAAERGTDQPAQATEARPAAGQAGPSSADAFGPAGSEQVSCNPSAAIVPDSRASVSAGTVPAREQVYPSQPVSAASLRVRDSTLCTVNLQIQDRPSALTPPRATCPPLLRVSSSSPGSPPLQSSPLPSQSSSPPLRSSPPPLLQSLPPSPSAKLMMMHTEQVDIAKAESMKTPRRTLKNGALQDLEHLGRTTAASAASTAVVSAASTEAAAHGSAAAASDADHAVTGVGFLRMSFESVSDDDDEMLSISN